MTVAALGVYAAYYGDGGLFEVVADGLYAYHGTLNYGTHEVEVKKLRILNAIYELGAAAVRFGEYGWINPLVNRTYQASEGYGFASWVRECQVLASQTHQFGEHEHGMAISTALAEIREHPILRPDLPGDCDPEGDDDAKRVYDHVLNSLCGFDYLYCVCVYAAGEGAAGAYPACIYFKPERVNTAIAGVFGNGGKGVHELLPDTDDEDIADGLRKFLGLVASEAMSHSPWVWYDSSGYVSQFLDAHPARDGSGN
ncbi:MAG: hypothetical protein IJ087_18655 [Eggerthellaceae bacterium]|nr:hypothetical protein [Eggerthellaceae bacterium]